MSGDQAFELIKLAIQAVIAAGAVMGAFLAYRTRVAVQDVHVSLNSRLSELLERTAQSARAEGVQGERDAQAIRDEQQGG